MSKTANINLNLTENDNTSFETWRKSIDGNNDSENKSNMQIVDEEIGQLKEGLNTHKIANDSHNDIRLLITELTNRLNALVDSDDTTLDQLSEIVAYIKNNKSLIEGVTTSKINITDIIDNLTTNVENKPLSAKQGVILKGLIDDLITSLNTANGYIGDHETRITTLESAGGGSDLYRHTLQIVATDSSSTKRALIYFISPFNGSLTRTNLIEKLPELFGNSETISASGYGSYSNKNETELYGNGIIYSISRVNNRLSFHVVYFNANGYASPYAYNVDGSETFSTFIHTVNKL